MDRMLGAAQANTYKPPQPEPSRISQADQNLRKTLSELEEAVTTLRDRLGPVIFDPPVPECPNGGLVPDQPMSILAEDLRNHARQAGRILDRVRHILSVIEI